MDVALFGLNHPHSLLHLDSFHAIDEIDSVFVWKDNGTDFKQIENGDLRVTQKEMEEWRKNFTQIVSSLVFTYKKLDHHSEAEAILADWLDKNPNDPVAQKLLEDLKKEMGKG